MGNFIGELLTLLGSFAAAPTLVAIAVVGIVLGTVAMLEMMQRVFYGEPGSDAPLADLGARELLLLVVLAAMLVALGLHPQPALDRSGAVIQELVVRDLRFDPADPEVVRDRSRIAQQPAARLRDPGEKP
jgi:NADH-quinone oxidoreductase subunit M